MKKKKSPIETLYRSFWHRKGEFWHRKGEDGVGSATDGVALGRLNGVARCHAGLLCAANWQHQGGTAWQ